MFFNRVWEKYSKLQRFLDKPIEIIDWENDFVFKKWKIEFKDLFFSYENNLRNGKRRWNIYRYYSFF